MCLYPIVQEIEARRCRAFECSRAFESRQFSTRDHTHPLLYFIEILGLVGPGCKEISHRPISMLVLRRSQSKSPPNILQECLGNKWSPPKKPQELEEQNYVSSPMTLNLWTKPGSFIFVCWIVTPKHGKIIVLEPCFPKCCLRNPNSVSY